MHILMVTPKELIGRGGGITTHVLNLSNTLTERGHKTSIIALSKENQHFNISGLDVYSLSSFNFPAFPYPSLAGLSIPYNFRHLNNLMKELLRQGVDVVHVHGHHYPSTWLATYVSRKLKIPCVLTLHGTTGLDPDYPFANLLENIFNKTILNFVLKNVDAVIGLTSEVTEYARKYVSDKYKYFTIPNGISLQSFQKNLQNKQKYREKYGLPADKKIVLFIGRFSHSKGASELANATGSISAEYPRTFFLFVGDGPLYPRIKKVTDSMTDKKMMVFTWVPHSNIHEFYIASDIYVLPSKREALPMTIIEAMASRLHIVATPVGGISDVLSSYPWKTYMNNFSSNAIVDALDKSIDMINSDRSENDITRAISYIRKFDLTKTVEQTEKVYYEAIKEWQ